MAKSVITYQADDGTRHDNKESALRADADFELRGELVKIYDYLPPDRLDSLVRTLSNPINRRDVEEAVVKSPKRILDGEVGNESIDRLIEALRKHRDKINRSFIRQANEELKAKPAKVA